MPEQTFRVAVLIYMDIKAPTVELACTIGLNSFVQRPSPDRVQFMGAHVENARVLEECER